MKLHLLDLGRLEYDEGFPPDGSVLLVSAKRPARRACAPELPRTAKLAVAHERPVRVEVPGGVHVEHVDHDRVARRENLSSTYPAPPPGLVAVGAFESDSGVHGSIGTDFGSHTVVDTQGATVNAK
jgi:hypothetical protein